MDPDAPKPKDRAEADEILRNLRREKRRREEEHRAREALWDRIERRRR